MSSFELSPPEEAAFKNLLEFMHSNMLPANDILDVLDVLVIADKFDVAACMTHCCQLLLDQDKTVEAALLYLGIPSSVLLEGSHPVCSLPKLFSH